MNECFRGPPNREGEQVRSFQRTCKVTAVSPYRQYDNIGTFGWPALHEVDHNSLVRSLAHLHTIEYNELVVVVVVRSRTDAGDVIPIDDNLVDARNASSRIAFPQLRPTQRPLPVRGLNHRTV